MTSNTKDPFLSLGGTTDLVGLDRSVPKSPAQPIEKKKHQAKSERTNVRTNEQIDEYPNVRTYERTPERTQKNAAPRKKIRHSFDIYEDQLRQLQILQFKIFQSGTTKPKLGEMVRQAIDLFLEKNIKG